MDLSTTTVTWRGLTFSGVHGAPFGLSTLEGWSDLPPARRDTEPRQQAHGRFDGPVWSDERTIIITGSTYSAEERDARLLALESAAAWPSGQGSTEELVVTHGGRTLTAFARLTRFKPTFGGAWASGGFPYAIEWVAPDPLRYSPPMSVATTFPVLRGGLEYDLYTDGAGTDLGYLDYGEASDTGRIVVSNPGSAAVPILFQVEGPVDPSGFDIAQVDSDRRLRFSGPVSAGSVLVLDGATGNVLIDGSADRGGLLTYRDWPLIPPGGSIELAFIPLGVDLGARLTAVVRPGSW
ncbi:hypothetical protein QUV83_08255 [Cellulomonas cellasea]|uniref:hypothetical protein n=1 Tax=Cellulomonas cellasea TaxID=43670 RepID=UPI0025A33B39|nr:hypothetical protein [Cellulomonas cellasea]MDM8084752.1 hypothetical protein [Cellulomonas cellasea]